MRLLSKTRVGVVAERRVGRRAGWETYAEINGKAGAARGETERSDGRVFSRLRLLVLWWERWSCALTIEFARPLVVLRTTGIEPTHENQKACVAASAQLVP